MSLTSAFIPSGRMIATIRNLDSINYLIGSEERGWSETSLCLFRGGLPEFRCWNCPDSMVVFFLDSESFIECRQAGATYAHRCDSRGITILAGGQEHDARCDGSPLVLICVITPAQLEEYVRREFDASMDEVVIRECVAEEDPVMQTLGEDLATELRCPIAWGRVRAENLQQRLLAQLLLRHSSLRRGVELPRTSLIRRRLYTVLHFIEERLGDEGLTLERIAGEVGLSPFCFARSFREEMGLPPHRYVRERRVARARQLLHQPERTIAEVAYAVGFSSQSHLTMVFRNHVGVTPGDYRRTLAAVN
jgi:AraC family transcriptional regulator